MACAPSATPAAEAPPTPAATHTPAPLPTPTQAPTATATPIPENWSFVETGDELTGAAFLNLISDGTMAEEDLSDLWSNPSLSLICVDDFFAQVIYGGGGG